MKNLSLLLLAALIPVSTPPAQSAPATPLVTAPRAGEIALEGTIMSLDVVVNTITLRALKKLPQPPGKVIQIGAATQFLAGGAQNLSLGDLEKGLKIRVVGREIKGKAFAARLVTWQLPAPQLELDPLTPRAIAPFLPAPQTQNGITLRIVDAGWKSLAQLWSQASTRPLFYFAYNMPGESDGQRNENSGGWVTSVALRNTRLVQVAGPNGEPVTLNTSGAWQREDGSYGATRAAFTGVNPAWNHVVAEFETLDPQAPVGASGEFSSTLSFEKAPVPAQNGEKVAVAAEMKTAHGAKIVWRNVRVEKAKTGADNLSERMGQTFFDFVVTPPADVPDLKVALDMEGVKNENDNAWPYHSWGTGGNLLHVDAVPGEADKFLAPSIKVKESAPSLKKTSWYRRFRVEIPVAALSKIAPPQLAPLAPVLQADGQAVSVQIEHEPGENGRQGNWSATMWIKNRVTDPAKTGDKTERWMLREAKARADGKEIRGWTYESDYDRQFIRANGVPSTSDEHSNPLVIPFSTRPEKFDLELKLEQAHRLESFGWLRGVPLPAPGASLNIRDGQFENDNVRVRRVFRFKNASELPGLPTYARENFQGGNLAVVVEILTVFPGATTEIPGIRVRDNKGLSLETSRWPGDVGATATENSKLQTLILSAPEGNKTLDLWLNTLETAWSGRTETLTLKDVAGKS